MSPPDATVTITAAPRASAARREPEHLVFLGTYTDHSILPHWPRGGGEGAGLQVGRWAAHKDRVEVLHTVPIVNPAVMKYHPRLNVLYVLSECIHTEGYVTAFNVDPHTGKMVQLGQPLSMTGRSTCYMAFDKDARFAVIANYWDGKLNVIQLDEATGQPLAVVQEHQQTRRESWRQVVDRADHMANRQDGPHAHCCVFDPSYRWLFVPDLGDNCIHQYGYSNGRITHEAFIPCAPGDGPRHFVFNPRLPMAYSGCELKSQVQVFSVDTSNPSEVRPRITPVQRLSCLPEDFTALNYVGEIKIDAAGRNVYVSNRGHHSIATFHVDQTTGLLTRAGVDSTHGKTPRHFGLSPCGGFAVVGDQDSDVIKVFRICPQTGRLGEIVQSIETACPNFVLFQRPHPVPEGKAMPTDYPEPAAAALQEVAVCAN